MTHLPAQRARPALAVPLALLVLALGLGFLALGLGAVATPPAQLWAGLTGGDALTRQLVLELRLPRVLASLLGGAMFAVSGALLQGVARNPLASPDLVGVGAGAGLAVTLLLLAFPGSPAWALPWGAFAGAWLAFLTVLTLARDGARLPPVRLALLGIAVAAALGAAQQLLLVRAPDGVGAALTFLTGTVYGADWDRLGRLWPWAAAGLPATLLLAHRLDLLALGEDSATALGVRVPLARYVALTVAVGLAAAAVSACGILGFVGLVAPHLARLLVGPRHLLMLPTAGLLGALLVLLADTVGRAALPPLEIPAGLITTLLGAPYFLFLLRRSAKAG
ncbi:FecCD family ABC transporter permease [Deinococcus hopiensis]|uniref:Iron complex transport system permease protein n=1 Tax=Deinococcus hopiensis KR-140 TaxID=695939 RepID=A0A1W1VEE1_9DEIO|nr:iron ABC transporter permease [Deinococcus hopiensis]SMB91738.1 iron complex transport system permease protein [Deinococcus hopiensis KR-140]